MKKNIKEKCKIKCCDREVKIKKRKLCTAHAQRFYKSGKNLNKQVRKRKSGVKYKKKQ